MAVKSESLGLNGQNNNSNAIALGNQRELSRSSTHKRGAANKSHSVSSNPGALRGISSKKKRSNLYVTNESDTSKKKSTLKSSHASQRQGLHSGTTARKAKNLMTSNLRISNNRLQATMRPMALPENNDADKQSDQLLETHNHTFNTQNRQKNGLLKPLNLKKGTSSTYENAS